MGIPLGIMQEDRKGTRKEIGNNCNNLSEHEVMMVSGWPGHTFTRTAYASRFI